MTSNPDPDQQPTASTEATDRSRNWLAGFITIALGIAATFLAVFSFPTQSARLWVVVACIALTGLLWQAVRDWHLGKLNTRMAGWLAATLATWMILIYVLAGSVEDAQTRPDVINAASPPTQTPPGEPSQQPPTRTSRPPTPPPTESEGEPDNADEATIEPDQRPWPGEPEGDIYAADTYEVYYDATITGGSSDLEGSWSGDYDVAGSLEGLRAIGGAAFFPWDASGEPNLRDCRAIPEADRLLIIALETFEQPTFLCARTAEGRYGYIETREVEYDGQDPEYFRYYCVVWKKVGDR